MEIKASERCISAIKQFEGFKSVAYHDIGGRLTLGYGETSGIKLNQVCTEPEADLMLRAHVAQIQKGLEPLVTVPLTQGQQDAIIDFSYNLGVGHFSGSSLLRLLNAGEFQQAADEFPKWSHVGNKVIPGLLRRRETEREWFLNA